MNSRIIKISTLVAAVAFCSQNVTAQQGFGTNQPSKASAIEMKSESKGLLIPRVSLTALNSLGPIKGGVTISLNDVNSLLVYNTKVDATATLSPGYYYWTVTTGQTNGTVGTWKRLMASDDATALVLAGDVTGVLGSNTVEKIQGKPVADTAPANNQVLTWSGTAWEPKTITSDEIGSKANLSVQDGVRIAAGSGTNALLTAATIGITDGGIKPVKIERAQGALPLGNRMVMVTQTDGTVTWIPQTDIAPTTTNSLTFGTGVDASKLTSNVNSVQSTVDLGPVIKTNETLTSLSQNATSGLVTYTPESGTAQTANILSGTTGNVLTYNGGVFLNETAIQNNQEKTIVAGTAPVTVGTPTTSGNDKTYTVEVSNATTTNVGVVKPGAGMTVDTNGALTVTGYTNTEQLTGKKLGAKDIYEVALTVTISGAETNKVVLPPGTNPDRILGMRMISHEDNSISTELSRYDETARTLVFGSGRTTQFQKIGTYDLILEYTKL